MREGTAVLSVGSTGIGAWLRPVFWAGLCVLLIFGGVSVWAQNPPSPEAEEVMDAGEDEELVEEEIVEEELLEEEPPAAPAPRRLAPARRVSPPRPRPVRPRVTTSRPRGIAPAPSSASTDGEAEEHVVPSPTGEKEGAIPTEPVSFDFRERTLLEVIEAISRLTGRNFDVDPNIAATTVTLITHDKIPADMAYEVLESILASRGFSMVETLDGHLVKIIGTPEVVQNEKEPLHKGVEMPEKGYDNFATHVVQVQYADPAELGTALRLLASRNARVDTYMPTRTLIITDTADGLRRMFDFLKEADVPGGETVMEIFTLEYTRAEVLQGQLEQVLMDGAGTPGGAKPVTPTRVPTRPTRRTSRTTVPGSSTPQVIGSSEETLRVVPDERLNALIVMATAGMMEQVRDLVNRLDTPTPYEANNLHIYELLNADAEQVEQALQPLVGTAPRKAGGAAGGTAAAGGGEIQPFESKVQVMRYDQTNSLLIVASPQDYQLLEAFIARLDVPQRQVLVDAVVMDVSIDGSYGVAVDAAGITGNDGFGLTSTQNISALVSGLNTTADTATNLVSPGGQLALGLMGLGSKGGMTTGIFDDIEVEVNGQKTKIPFVPVLLQAIETVSDLEVLSQPSLVTVDNEEASIVVGQEVPYITSTSSSRNSDGTVNNNNYGGYTRVQREEVGVKLKVTPQISEGDNVLLDMEVEVSAIAGADQTVGSVDILGPTTNKTLVQNRVLVKDGGTAVLAGLIRDTASRSRRQAPILGDLPVLGWLFRSKSNSSQKRNLVMLVTPHIVKENVDLERATQHKVNEYHESNMSELFEQGGFFRKIKLKSKRRKEHRPTLNRSEAITGRRSTTNYGRGDIRR